MFENVDLNDFWMEEEYTGYLSAPVTDDLIREIEAELGYKLPASYVYLMKQHNGGCPKRTVVKGTYCKIVGIYGIGREENNSLCGFMGYSNWIDEWEYPKIGIPICDTITGGHTMVFLDYRECGKDGEPKVVEIDQESDYEITVLAENFEEFIGKLVYEEENEIEKDPSSYKGIEMYDVEGKDRSDIRRAVWGEWSWGFVLGWEVVLIAAATWIKVSGTHNWFLLRISRISLFCLVIHTLLVIAFVSSCFMEVRRIKKYYEDTVDLVWEEKDKKYFSLAKTSERRYSNVKGYRPGDEVKVFIGKRREPFIMLKC